MVCLAMDAFHCPCLLQCDGSPGKEEATFNLLVDFKALPPKKPGTVPKFIIDVYDNKGVRQTTRVSNALEEAVREQSNSRDETRTRTCVCLHAAAVTDSKAVGRVFALVAGAYSSGK